VPAERTLAAVTGTSRGTVVACFDELVKAGVLTRRQGAGTYVAGRPSWAARPAGSSVATMLLRRVAEDRESIDLSLSAPGDLRHLPHIDAGDAWQSLDGHGLDPAGLPQLRTEVARHLTDHQRLPTDPGQLVITAGAQEALWLLIRTLPAARVLASCPTYPGLASALAGTRAERAIVPADAAGDAPTGIERAGRAPDSVAYLMPTGHNPAGTVMPLLRRQALAAVADAGRVTVVEDLTLADLMLGAPRHAAPPPLAALSTRVVAVGSVSKVLWGGLRVGWIRAAEPLRSAIIARKAALNLGTAVISQALAARLLAAIDADWLAAHRAALTQRRDLLLALVARHLPAWRAQRPAAGLSLWAQLPLDNADAFAHAAAARHGVTIMAGGAACADGRHRHFARLSFAEQPGTLELAAERLAVAWELHAENLAASPAAGFSYPERARASARPVP
jgi:DNA-binding transcriptional MocR family regulator